MTDSDYVEAFQQTLKILKPISVKGHTSNIFRRILVRERIGLQWNSYPEAYWEMHVVVRIQKSVNVVDIGANVGQFTIPTAEHGHNVYAFEPNPETCKILENKIHSKRLSERVHIVCAAAGEKSGQVSFSKTNVSTSFQQSKSNGRARQTVSIFVRRVDDEIVKDTSVFLFKTDTQGYELGVLKGANQLLSSVFLLVVEFSYGLFSESKTSPLELLDYIYDLGFVCTYMAFHTRMMSEANQIKYSMVPGYPKSTENSMSFEAFIDNLKQISAPNTLNASGWTDLMCWRPSVN